MPLADLPEGLQNIAIYNFEMFTRAFWIFIMVAISLIYIFYWRPNHQEKTPFMSVAVMQGIIYVFSIVVLVASPLFFFGMSPQIDVWRFIYPFFDLYLIFMVVYIITLNVDLIKYGFPVLLKMGGLKTDDPEVNKVYNKLFGRNKNGNVR